MIVGVGTEIISRVVLSGVLRWQVGTERRLAIAASREPCPSWRRNIRPSPKKKIVNEAVLFDRGREVCAHHARGSRPPARSHRPLVVAAGQYLIERLWCRLRTVFPGMVWLRCSPFWPFFLIGLKRCFRVTFGLARRTGRSGTVMSFGTLRRRLCVSHRRNDCRSPGFADSAG
jgi:hypothetical protein